MSHIVILGAGFGGIHAALDLDKQFAGNSDIKITIIDTHDYQLFHEQLYEVATAEEELTETKVLKKSITVPLLDIFRNTRVDVLKGMVVGVDSASQKVLLEGTEPVSFDYLVLAIGSTTDYFNIPGAQEYSFALKSLRDALRIRNEISFTIERYRMDVHKKNIRIIVAGGGYTGCEFAAELGNMIEILALKNNYPPEKIEIVIMEAMSELIPGLDSRLSEDAYNRLRSLGIRIQLSSMITAVEDGFVQLTSGEKEAFDLLVWTTGVKAKSLPFIGSAEPMDRKERFNTKTCLQLLNHQNIFSLGDCACIFDGSGRPLAPTAQNAIHQAHHIAYSIKETIAGRVPKDYVPAEHGLIVTLGGKWSIFRYNGWYIKGRVGWWLRVVSNLRYFAHVVGWSKALRIVLLQTELYSRND